VTLPTIGKAVVKIPVRTTSLAVKKIEKATAVASRGFWVPVVFTTSRKAADMGKNIRKRREEYEVVLRLNVMYIRRRMR
jgi:hypothetical protein